ncbi:MAG: N-formylglutamate amidohydrolase, partial [Alphaproteobacteria bacterium]|nr:N-formylglutamate amidohydrolase [Alphaproteobacteria bacterium]
MSQPNDGPEAARPAFEVLQPARQSTPIVYASPHSGDYYPPEFVAESRLDPLTLRKSEDSFVDALFGAAPAFGSPLLRARYARVYLDVNREPFELDPGMFRDPLPPQVNSTSLRVAGGLGTIARVVADGAEVYRDKLSFAEAEDRLARIYHPYHAALADLLRRTRARFGQAVLIDCHSMPSVGGPMDADGGHRRPDIVLGDRFGTAAAPALVDFVQATLSDLGYAVGRNAPYAGGFTT